MRSGWYLVCSYCNAQVYVSRWEWSARLLFWSMRRLKPRDSALFCGLAKEIKTVSLVWRNYESMP